MLHNSQLFEDDDLDVSPEVFPGVPVPPPYREAVCAEEAKRPRRVRPAVAALILFLAAGATAVALAVTRPREFTVNLSNGGESVRVSVKGETLMERPDDPETPEGFRFEGWFYIDDSSRQDALVIFPIRIVESVSIYARFSYAVEYNLNGAGRMSGTVERVSMGKKGSLPAPEASAGTIFAGWYTENGAAGVFDEERRVTNYSQLVTGDVTLFARWTYRVTYDLSGVTVTPDGFFAGNTGVTEIFAKERAGQLPVPSARNFTFAGWYRERDFVTSVSDYADARGATLYAKWLFTVEFDAGGVGGNPATTNVTKGDSSALPDLQGRTSAYKFEGWYLSFTAPAGFDGKVAKYSDMAAGGAKLYAKWTYKITYIMNGVTAAANPLWVSEGAGAYSYMVVKGSDGAIPAPTAAGYAFEGWYGDAAFTGEAVTDYSEPSGHATLYAKWTYRVIFNLNGVAAVAPGVVAPNGASGALPTPSEIPYNWTFAGWYLKNALDGRFDEARKATDYSDLTVGDATLYAKWTYALSFSTGGIGKTPDTLFLTKGETGAMPTYADAGAPAGWTLAGWYADAGFSGPVVFDYSQLAAFGGCTAYARWTYDVVFEAGEAGYGMVKTLERGAAGALPTAADAGAPSGWVLEGWYREAGFKTKVTDYSDLVSGNVTLYAKWTRI